ncbi:hypothetical protein IZT76_07805 [Helicobacter pylori]|uniref:hypothetical protein n=1 Tax=Helicobacter pylori TaxID=210 RepID=UPI0018E1B521|nr:hypothetical protein [Helicobacter pylori]MBI1562128.1 hypothetical protein [Helicobacter pylori]
MRRKNETATSFNQLREITQAIQAQKNSAQTSDNANTSELTPKGALKPKGSAHAKKGALTTQAEIPNIFSVWDECFSSARNYKNPISKTNLDFLYTT